MPQILSRFNLAKNNKYVQSLEKIHELLSNFIRVKIITNVDDLAFCDGDESIFSSSNLILVEVTMGKCLVIIHIISWVIFMTYA